MGLCPKCGLEVNFLYVLQNEDKSLYYVCPECNNELTGSYDVVVEILSKEY